MKEIGRFKNTNSEIIQQDVAQQNKRPNPKQRRKMSLALKRKNTNSEIIEHDVAQKNKRPNRRQRRKMALALKRKKKGEEGEEEEEKEEEEEEEEEELSAPRPVEHQPHCHVSGLGQMLNPFNTCYVSSVLQLLVPCELDLHLDPQVARTAREGNLDQVMLLLLLLPLLLLLL